MTQRGARKLDFRRKAFLSAVGLAVLALPVVFGLASAPQSRPSSQSQATVATAPRFEGVSIKSFESDPVGWHYGHTIVDPPNEGTFLATDVTVEALVSLAYGIQHSWLIQGAPSWLDTEAFDVQAKAGSAVDRELRALSPDQGAATKRRMLQALLADRFKLTTHRETKNLPVYALVVATNGPKLQEAKPGTYPEDGKGHAGRILMGPGQLTGQGLPMAVLVDFLSQWLGRTVLDQTGLKGNYDFTLKWTAEPGQGTMVGGPVNGNPGPEGGPPTQSPLLTAIQEELGLKLESTKGPMEVLVIDHVEKPSEN